MPEQTRILTPSGGRATPASPPMTSLECGRYALEDSSPAPWWVSTAWLLFFTVAFSNLMVSLLQLG